MTVIACAFFSCIPETITYASSSESFKTLLSLMTLCWFCFAKVKKNVGRKISINTHFVGHVIVYRATCPSTNQLAAQLLTKKKLTEGTLIITNASDPRKRPARKVLGRVSLTKNLTFSLVLHPTFLEAAASFSLTMSVSLAIQQVLSQYITNGLKLKWAERCVLPAS